MNLQNFGVQEMSTMEMTIVDGGKDFWDRISDAVDVVSATVTVAADFFYDAAEGVLQFGLGVAAGISDGLTAGLED